MAYSPFVSVSACQPQNGHGTSPSLFSPIAASETIGLAARCPLPSLKPDAWRLHKHARPYGSVSRNVPGPVQGAGDCDAVPNAGTAVGGCLIAAVVADHWVGPGSGLRKSTVQLRRCGSRVRAASALGLVLLLFASLDAACIQQRRASLSSMDHSLITSAALESLPSRIPAQATLESRRILFEMPLRRAPQRRETDDVGNQRLARSQCWRARDQ